MGIHDRRHDLVMAACRRGGIPEDPCAKVTCCDCGQEVISARCQWKMNELFEVTSGPHCGCVAREKINGS